MPTKKPKEEKLVQPSVTAVAVRMLNNHMLRAVARDWPGGSPDVFLERVDFGDEADPYIVTKSVKVQYNGERIQSMRFDEDGVHWEAGDRRWFVRASSDALSEKAIRDD